MLKKQALYQKLKHDIQQEKWPPGCILTQQQLATHYAVSRIVVRDAQQALLHDGWLVAHGKAGMQVPAFTAAEAEELCLIRLQLEPLALQLASAQLTSSQLDRAQQLLASSAAHSTLSPYQRGELNWQFHRVLYQSCNKAHLLRLLDKLHQQVSRYQGYQERALAYAATSASEHQQLIDLLRSGESAAACQLLSRHIATGNAALVAHLEKNKAPSGAF